MSTPPNEPDAAAPSQPAPAERDPAALDPAELDPAELDPADSGQPAAPVQPPSPPQPVAEPVLPGRSADDTDTGWGERPQDDDERYLRDVPPHW
jgi:hypothetical protein